MQIVDQSPGLYLFLSAWMIFLIGRELQKHEWDIVRWQGVIGGATFLMLVARRFVFSPPAEPSDAIDALFRAACFAMIAYGFTGVVSMVAIAAMSIGRSCWGQIGRSWKASKQRQLERAAAASRQLELEEKQRRQAIPPTPAELQRLKEEQEREQESRDRQQRISEQREADRQRRKELELKMKLQIQFAMDAERKKEMQQLMNEFTDTSLPVDQFEKRMAMIEDAIADFIPRANKNYQSVEHVLEDYAAKIQQVDDSDHPEEQKDSLRALLLMERDSKVQQLANQ